MAGWLRHCGGYVRYIQWMKIHRHGKAVAEYRGACNKAIRNVTRGQALYGSKANVLPAASTSKGLK
jgi:hypothetical protein